MDALDAVEWEACLLEPVRNPEAERMLRKEVGMVSPGARYFLDSEWVTQATVLFDLALLPTLHVDRELGEMIALVVSQENACRYCYEATRLIMRVMGFSDERIRQLSEDSLGGEVPPAQQAVLQFVRCVSRASPLATCLDGRPLLDAGYSSEAVREIAVLAAIYVFFNRLSTVPALPPTDFAFGQRWYMRMLRPVIARVMLRRRREGRRVSLAPGERSGPFAPIITALDGLPVAPRLRAVVDDAWASPCLPQRTKALVFAVVARGIRCPVSEREAERLLAEHGMSAADIEAALAHLGPGLDARERAAVSLARESIWYRPSSLQRHARSIRTLFSRQEFVELIGIASLANMLCRLGVSVELAGDAR